LIEEAATFSDKLSPSTGYLLATEQWLAAKLSFDMPAIMKSSCWFVPIRFKPEYDI
jgi:hypothetical protein